MGWLLGKFLAAQVIGAILSPIINGLLTAQKQKLDAIGSHEARVAELAQQAVALERREAEVNAQVVIAEQGNWMTRWVRPVWALPFIAFTWKVVVWDKMLGWGATDALDSRMWSVFMLMVGAYYGVRSAEKVATTIAGAFKR
jgi:hypothetical protein